MKLLCKKDLNVGNCKRGFVSDLFYHSKYKTTLVRENERKVLSVLHFRLRFYLR